MGRQMIDELIDFFFGVVEVGGGPEAAYAGGDDRAILLAEMIDDPRMFMPGGDEADDAAGFVGNARADHAVALGANAFGESLGQHLDALPDFVNADFHEPVEGSAQ